jgi:hypothetical protein
LLIPLTDDPARRWVHKMHTLTREARHGFVGLIIV